jgi:hypothetical protein
MRKTKRRHRGGFLGFGEEPNNSYSNTTYSNTYPTTSSSTSSLDNILNSVKNAYNSTSQSVSNAYNSVSNPTPTYTSTYPNSNEKKWYDISGWLSGGKRSKSRKRRGGTQVGYPDLSLATDVNGIKVVEPTYWIKGGKRSRSKSKSKSKSRRSRRYRKK